MNRHERLLENAKEAIEAVFSDTSVSQQTTLASLGDLKDDIELKEQCIQSDLAKARTKP